MMKMTMTMTMTMMMTMMMMMMLPISLYRTCCGGGGGGGDALDALRRALSAAAKLLLVCHEHHLQTLLGCLALHSDAGLLLQAKYFLADHESVALPALLLVLVGQVEAGAGELHLLAA